MQTTQQVAVNLGYNEAHVRRMCIEGRITAMKLGKQWMIAEEEVRRLQKLPRNGRGIAAKYKNRSNYPRRGEIMERPKPHEASTRLSLGQLVATPGALDALKEAGVEPARLLARHQQGDWGDLGTEDKHLNDAAVKEGDRILSAYILPTGVKVWIITEWDRSVTTLLLPNEY